MGSSMRKKRKGKASGTTVKVGRMKKVGQKVKVVPVLLPGATDATEWNKDTTHQGNFTAMGIVSDPNKFGKTGRNSSMLLASSAATGGGGGAAAAAKAKADAAKNTTVAGQATVGGDEVRGLLGQVRSTGLAPPKRLTTKQRRIVGALVAKHGDDLNAMARDRKLNALQHTVSQLRELVVSFVAYPDLLEGGGSVDFRAPKKMSLRRNM